MSDMPSNGTTIQCPDCGGFADNTGGSTYSCRNCGGTFEERQCDVCGYTSANAVQTCPECGIGKMQ